MIRLPFIIHIERGRGSRRGGGRVNKHRNGYLLRQNRKRKSKQAQSTVESKQIHREEEEEEEEYTFG